MDLHNEYKDTQRNAQRFSEKYFILLLFFLLGRPCCFLGKSKSRLLHYKMRIEMFFFKLRFSREFQVNSKGQ